MSLEAVTRAALRYFDPETAIVMVAIAGAESAYRLDARGDPLSIFPPARQAAIRPYSCLGYTSFGPWQVHLPAHAPTLAALTGSSDPCAWAAWLSDPDHSAQMARIVYDRQGFRAWTAYNNGAYLGYLGLARRAVEAAIRGEPLPPAPVAPEPPPGAPVIVIPGDP